MLLTFEQTLMYVSRQHDPVGQLHAPILKEEISTSWKIIHVILKAYLKEKNEKQEKDIPHKEDGEPL